VAKEQPGNSARRSCLGQTTAGVAAARKT